MTTYTSALIILFITLYFQNCVCRDADITEFPSIVSIRFKENSQSLFQHICSGSIINSSVVLTSASCFPDQIPNLSSYQIVAASNVYDGSTGSVAIIDHIVKHYEYQTKNIASDLALVFLKTPIYIDNAKTAIPTIKDQILNSGSLVAVSGWPNGAQPGTLLKRNSIMVQYCNPRNQILCGTSTNLCENGPGSLLWDDMQLVGLLSKNGDCNNGVESFTSVLASTYWLKKTLDGENLVLRPEFL